MAVVAALFGVADIALVIVAAWLLVDVTADAQRYLRPQDQGNRMTQYSFMDSELVPRDIRRRYLFARNLGLVCVPLAVPIFLGFGQPAGAVLASLATLAILIGLAAEFLQKSRRHAKR